MDTTLPQKFPFVLDRNLAKANCTGNRIYTIFNYTIKHLIDILIFAGGAQRGNRREREAREFEQQLQLEF